MSLLLAFQGAPPVEEPVKPRAQLWTYDKHFPWSLTLLQRLALLPVGDSPVAFPPLPTWRPGAHFPWSMVIEQRLPQLQVGDPAIPFPLPPPPLPGVQFPWSQTLLQRLPLSIIIVIVPEERIIPFQPPWQPGVQFPWTYQLTQKLPTVPVGDPEALFPPRPPSLPVAQWTMAAPWMLRPLSVIPEPQALTIFIPVFRPRRGR